MELIHLKHRQLGGRACASLPTFRQIRMEMKWAGIAVCDKLHSLWCSSACNQHRQKRLFKEDECSSLSFYGDDKNSFITISVCRRKINTSKPGEGQSLDITNETNEKVTWSRTMYDFPSSNVMPHWERGLVIRCLAEIYCVSCILNSKWSAFHLSPAVGLHRNKTQLGHIWLGIPGLRSSQFI